MKKVCLSQLLIFLTLMLSCVSNNNEKIPPERADSAYNLFKLSQEANGIEKKLSLLDEALTEMKNPEDTLRALIHDHKIYYFLQLKELDSSLHYANLLLREGLNRKDTSQIAKAYYRRARSFFFKDEHVNALRDMFQSQKYYLSVGDSINSGKRLVELGISQSMLGDFAGSQNSQVKALKLLKTSIDSVFMASIYNNLATSYRHLNDLDEAIDEYYNALRFSSSRKDSVTIINNIANIYTEKGDYEISLNLFESILPYNQESKVANRTKDNYFFTQWLQKKTDIEDSLKNILESRINNNDLNGLLASYDHLISFNLENNPSEALHYAEKYYQTAQKINSASDKIRALDHLIRLVPENKSRKYAIEYITLNDSLVRAQNNVKNLFAKIKYDEEQKIEQIEQLERLSDQQKLVLLERRNQRNIAILLGMIFIGIAFFYNYYLKQRNRKSRIREIHDTEARISKKIHDELANDVYNVMTELENSSIPDNEAVLNNLESIYSRTRNISRENTPINIGSDYQEDLHYMLSKNTPADVKLFITGFHEIAWDKINHESKIVIHRVLQELMINMKKHSKASIVSLNFKELSTKLKIIYTDNGVGITPENLKKGSGLKNVENRLDSIQGSLHFQSDISAGFSSDILIPV